MAYKKAELERMALDAIKKHDLIRDNEVWSFLPCCEKTYYNWKLQELQSIKRALHHNRISQKVEIRKDWARSDNPTKQAMHYKLIADEDELDRLNGKPTQVTQNNMPVLKIEEV